MIGESPAVRDLMELIARIASSKTNVLIFGESGTGKELVARLIHESGPLKEFPFVAVNCGAIPENLVETEMFGHTKGSFTGAVSEKVGLFEVAHRGSIFLDEIGELSLGMQVKLLRVIQERIFRKVGGVQDVRVEVRIIAATNRDLEALVAAGRFREDLYYRLNVILVRTPPLRSRTGDIAILARYFLKKFSERNAKNISEMDPKALDALESYSWPGNVRELENCMERAVTMESGEVLSWDSLPPQLKTHTRSVSDTVKFGAKSELKFSELGIPAPDFEHQSIQLEEILSRVEKVYILAVLEHTGGAKKRAAELLGISLRSLRYKMIKLGL